jgi:hypothetical protein
MAYNPKFQINLTKIFHKAYADDRALRDAIRPTLSNPTFRAVYGKAVIDRIIERTLSGIDRDGIKFKSYSKSYINSDIFKIYAKNPSEVNLKLTGEMLASLTTTNTDALITVELLGEENKAKAHGHKYGLGKKKVRRDFLGLPESELVELMRDSMELTRNDAFEAAAEFFENTTIADIFGQVGNQEEFAVSVLTPEVLQLLAEEEN